MFECPTCLNEVDVSEKEYDPDYGECCIYCAEEFQQERDIYADHLRKSEKEGY